ncbi:unnamed protein product [Sympodiomycopsis kandeliae]
MAKKGSNKGRQHSAQPEDTPTAVPTSPLQSSSHMIGLGRNPLDLLKRIPSGSIPPAAAAEPETSVSEATSKPHFGRTESEMTSITEMTAMSSDEIRATTPLTTPSASSIVAPDEMRVRSTHKPSLADIMKTKVIKAVEDITHDVYDECGSLEFFLEYLAEERLMHMPAKNSAWDQILRQASEIGTQIDRVAEACGDRACASITLTNVQLLLEVGHHQARTLQPLIELIWNVSMLLTRAWRLSTSEQVGRDSVVHSKLSSLFEDVVRLITSTTIEVRQRINSLSPVKSQTIDIGRSFGKSIDNIEAAYQGLSKRIWLLVASTHKPVGRSVDDINDSLSLHHTAASHKGALRYELFAQVAWQATLAPGSCEWFQSPLLDFLRAPEDVLQVTGAAGSGKSTLARWTQHRLQRQLGRRSYETLFVSDHHSKTELSVVKSLLKQLLDSKVGDMDIYCDLARAVQLAEESEQDSERVAAEQFWECLDRALAGARVHTVVLVDGLRTNSFDRLHKAIHNHKLVKLITFGALHSNNHPDYHITKDVNRRDISSYLRDGLQSRITPAEAALVTVDEDHLNKLVEQADGSFLWAYLYLQLTAKDATVETDGLDVNGLLEQLSKDLSKQAKLALQFMLVAQRVFSCEEVDALVEQSFNSRRELIGSPLVEEHRGHLYFRHSAIHQYLRSSLIKNETEEAAAHSHLLRKILLAARAALREDCEPTLTSSGDRLYDAVLLEYAVRHWIQHYILSGLKAEDLRDHFPSSARFAQLEWAVYHTHRSIGKHSLSLSVREGCFGKGVGHRATLQSYIILATLYRHKGDNTRAAEYFFRACSMGQVCLGEMSIIAVTCSSIFLVLTDAFEFESKTELCIMREQMIRFTIRYCKLRHGAQSEVVVKWYEVLIKLLVGVKEEQSVLVILYEELYEILICMHGGDKSHPKVKHICKEMNDLKMVIHGDDEHDVVQYRDWIFETGEDHEHEHGEWSYERLLILIKLARRFAYHHEHHVHWHQARRLFLLILRRAGELCRHQWSLSLYLFKMDICIEFAELLHKHGHHHEAHHILITLWAEWEEEEVCEHRDILIRLKKIAIILRGLGSLQITLDIFTKIFGWFKSFGGRGGHGGERPEPGHFGGFDDDEALQVTVLITEVIEEIEETTKETKTIVRTTRTETVVREVFETHYERCRRSGKTDKHFHKAVEVLIKLLLESQDFVECEIILRRTLKLTWRWFIRGGKRGKKGSKGKTGKDSSSDSGSEEEGESEGEDGGSYDGDIFCGHGGDRDEHIIRCLHLVRHLAHCHHQLGHFDHAERYYWRILRVCLHTFAVDHEHVTHAWRTLIAFYEEHHRHDKVIEVYLDILVRYRKHCGASHELTISILYALGRLCKKMGLHQYIEYYLEIVEVLEVQHCFEAAWVVCEFYYEHRRWKELKGLCGSLWGFFCSDTHCEFFTEEIVLCLYEWYICTHTGRPRGGKKRGRIGHGHGGHGHKGKHGHGHSHDDGDDEDEEDFEGVDIEVIYTLTVEFKDIIRVRFGSASSVLIKILIALAKICEQREEHWHEAITIYEEVITTTVTETTEVITEEVVHTVKKRLSHVYVQVITRGRIGGGQGGKGHVGHPGHYPDPDFGGKALKWCMEVYLRIKMELGSWHERTLLQLEQVILIHFALGGDEHHHHMIRLLRGVVLEIVTTCHDSVQLYKAAYLLATLYVKVSLRVHLEGFLHKLHHLIVLPDMPCEHDFEWHGDAHLDCSALVFLVTCRRILRIGHCHDMSFSEVMAEVLLEMHLYREVRSVKVTTDVSVEVFVQTVARLHRFWRLTERNTLCRTVLLQVGPRFRDYFRCLHGVEDESIALFFEGLCESYRFYGEGECKNVAHAFVLSTNIKVKALLVAERFEAAHEVARCALLLAREHHHYFSRNNVAAGYKLAELIAGIDVNSCQYSDGELYSAMLSTSREIIAEVLFACEKTKMDFVSLRFEDVTGLLRLLGTQGNFLELEKLLLHLWQSREVQRTWRPATVLSIGLALVHAHVAAEHVAQAITLCDTICYNLRRSGDWLDEQAVQASHLLAQLYTLSGQHAKAMAVHEEVLREVDEEGSPAVYEKYAQRQVDTFRRSMARNGGYGKSQSSLDLLFGSFVSRGFICDSDVNEDGDDHQVDYYQAPKDWYLLRGPAPLAVSKTRRHHLHEGKPDSAAARRVRAAARRSYGCGQVSLAAAGNVITPIGV